MEFVNLEEYLLETISLKNKFFKETMITTTKKLLKNSGKSVIFKTIDSHIPSDGYYQKKIKQKISIIGEVVEKLEPLFTLGGLVKCCNYYGKHFLKK